MLRRWLLWIVTIAFIWVVISRFTQIEKLAQTIATGKWNWVLAAAGLQAVYFVMLSGIYWMAFRTVDVHTSLAHLLPLTFSSFFLNLVAPAGGAAGNALFVDDAARRGNSPARAAAGVLLFMIIDFVGFTFLLIAGLIILFRQHDLKIYEVAASIFLMLTTAALTALLLMGLWHPTFQRKLVFRLQRLINRTAVRFKRNELLEENWAERTAEEFKNAAIAIGAHPYDLAAGLGISIFSHLLNVLCIYCLFRAFYQTVNVSTLVAGYAIGILFWIVSITPQGVGIVEGLMALTFTSLDVPAEPATIIAIVYRGLNVWLPVMIGFVLIRRVKTFSSPQAATDNRFAVRLAALLTAAMGMINLISAVVPVFLTRIQVIDRLLPLEVRRGSRMTAALAGFALLLLAANLWRRKRIAWIMTVVVLFISAVSHLLKGLDYEAAALAAVLAIWLSTMRADYHARSDLPSVKNGIRVLLLAVVFTLVYGTAGFYLQDRQYSVHFNLWQAVNQTIVMFTQFYNPGLQPVTRFGQYFADSIYIIGATTIGYALVMLVRPVLIRLPSSPEEQSHARLVIQAHGRSSLARICLLDDKCYYFSPGGSVVSYVVKGRVAITLGDPIGPADDLPSAIRNFKAHCQENDWLASFYQVPKSSLNDYHSAGFQSITIGEEAIVHLAAFSLEGSANKPLRNAYHHVLRTGYQACWYLPPQSRALIEQLRSISDEWLSSVHGTEKRFSVGWFDDHYLSSCPILVIQAPDGKPIAFSNIIQEYQKNEISIDLMRHRRELVNGIMEFLFIAIIEWGQSQGYETFSLGLSALAGVGKDVDDPAVEKALHYIYEHVDEFYNFKGLHEFKDKFHPEWSPRYLVFPGSASLPAIAIAMARADSGDDFLWNYRK